MVLRRFWEPHHEAQRMLKVAENARMDQLQLREVSRTADEAAAKVQEEI